jgi:hypothetical protein
MNTTLKPGDRVRLNGTVTFGTVVEVPEGINDGRPRALTVEWDGHEGVRDAVPPEELTYVRPPPAGWSTYDRPQPFCDP